MKFLVFSDVGKNVSEIATKLRDLGEVHSFTLKSQRDAVMKSGSKKLVLLDGTSFSGNVSEALLKSDLSGYDYVFIASTPLGRDVAGIISAKTGNMIASEAFDFTIDNGKIRTKRFFFGGKTIMEEETGAKIVTVSPGSFESSESPDSPAEETITLPGSPEKLLEEKDREAGGTNIESAGIIVSVGRGIGSKEAIEKITPLVTATRGELAGSRPVCLDYRWLSEERQVGLSGKKVKPRVYIALGISGQIQHIAGMRGSKIVVAVNKDKDAPIFQECDYGIVGDLFQIVPKLVEKLKK